MTTSAPSVQVCTALVFLLCFSTGHSRAQDRDSGQGDQARDHKQGPIDGHSLLAIPPWAEVGTVNATDVHPLDKGGREFDPALGALPVALKPGFGPSSGMQVNLASGVESYVPTVDITARNPGGLGAVFQRSFRSDRALAGYGSPGLSVGWVHNFDVVIRPFNVSTGWSELKIVYPTGEEDHIKPDVDDNGNPTGRFKVANGAPFRVSAEPGNSVNHWKSIVVQWKGGVWVFAPTAADLYVLRQVENLTINWDAARHLTGVVDADSGKRLLTVAYSPQGRLQSVADIDGVTRTYEFEAPNGANGNQPCLIRVSQLFSGGAQPLVHWTYGYVAQRGSVLLSAVSVPSNGGQSANTAWIVYEEGIVRAHKDANGIVRRYTYSPGHTRVDVIGESGTTESFYTQNFDDLGRNIGRTDAAGNSTHIEYADGPPRQP